MRFRKPNNQLWKFFLISAFFLQIFNCINLKEVRSESTIDNQINGVINKSKNIQSSYLIGPGDVINIYFSGIDIFSGQYSVDSEGNIYMPEINKLNVLDLTFLELENKLLEIFKPIINNPSISVSLFKARNVSIFISGEINSPGLYRLTYKDEVESNKKGKMGGNMLFNPSGNISATVVGSQAPKLYDAIKKAKGFKNYADLSNIEIIRKNSISQGGGRIKSEVNFLTLLLEGDQTVNVNLQDGDAIFIKKANDSFIKKYTSIGSLNINPNVIYIYINGHASKLGEIAVPQGSSLNDAIAASGGRDFQSGKVELINVENDGRLIKKNIRYNLSAPKGSKRNPYLASGDIVIVNKNLLGKANTLLNELGSPLINAYGIISLFD